ncbi:carbohydrate kinase family protein [Clostridium sp. 1001271B_150615_H5]|uniref:carbohydrate kinase family protein n=1 Tax=Clostridium sp. 1001271B_150615_H5 TaxID=2787105 RepID=UPI001107370A|nr:MULTISPECIES: carbohydrate kinase family protein [unclassified Clostridium]
MVADKRAVAEKRAVADKRAVAAGHICIDITPLFPKGSAGEAGKILAPGSLVQMDGVDIHPGGAVANTGLAMKRLGVDVRLMGKIGKDELGTLILKCLEGHGAAEGMILSDQEKTSYSVVLAMPGIDRIFLHDPGANVTFSGSDLDFEAIKEAHLFHFGYPTLMRHMYQNQGEEMARMFRRIKEGGTAISLDMAAIDPSSEAAGADWKGILEKALPYVDFFVPSAEELCFMLDRERYREWTKRAEGRDITEVIQVKDVKPLGQMVLDMGAGAVLIKCGAPGIYYRTASGNRIEDLCRKLNLSMESWKDKEGFEPGFEPDTVVSGTGAGDTSIAAFLASVLREADLKEAVEMAAAAGACCVAAYDALSGLKSLEEMKERIRRGWRKGAYRP